MDIGGSPRRINHMEEERRCKLTGQRRRRLSGLGKYISPDCSASVVNHLATVAYNAIISLDKQVFKPSTSLPRTCITKAQKDTQIQAASERKSSQEAFQDQE